MINVTEARERIREEVRLLPVQQLALKDAAGLTLAAAIYAPTDIPGFIQSSVDGYALSFDHKNEPLEIVVEMAAGAANPHTITGNQAARIFTGAPLPIGADTVVMQEYCTVENGRLLIQDADIKFMGHVRPKGAEIAQGALAMQAGEQLTTAAIGFLAGIGIDKVHVYPAPRVSLLITGKEIRPPGTSLAFGQVYDSNSIMLGVALRSAGITQVQVVFVDDTLEDVKQQLSTALLQSDIVLLTGGISVGDYDFVLQATKDCGVAEHFHKVKQKPGKPLFFGTKEDVLVFGLPGNPSSSLTCFYEYVLPAMDQMMERTGRSRIATNAILQNNYNKKAGLTHFLKGYFEEGKVQLLHAQESFRLASYAKANCLILFEEDLEEFQAGQSIPVHLLPY